MKAFIVLACFFVAAQAMSWESFKSTHGKSYGSAREEASRKTIYEKNLKKIQEHNERFARGEVSHTLAINKFGDLTTEEFAKMANGFKSKKTQNPLHKIVGGAPSSIDWNQKGAVTGVKDQGQCGSCWSFSTTGSIEGQYFLKNNKLVSFSEQQLVDCSGNYGNDGCDGGLMDQAFQYIKAKGLETESTYPYTAEDGTCKFKSGSTVLKTIKSFVDVASGDESALQDAVANVGPISVAIDASNFSFQFYSSGVYNEPDCSSTSLDHGVLAVGYGSENGQDFWLVKNSWGNSWGLNGFIKMSRNVDNQCGIATQASYPVL